jgi:hypothetical protein
MASSMRRTIAPAARMPASSSGSLIDIPPPVADFSF